MGSCSSTQQKTILLLGTPSSNVISLYNKLIEHFDNNLSYKILFSMNYKDYDKYYIISNIIIYFLDITTNIHYQDIILLSKLSKNKNTPIYIFLNITNSNFTLNLKEIELIINHIIKNFNLFNTNITFIQYLDTMKKFDILNIINIL